MNKIECKKLTCKGVDLNSYSIPVTVVNPEKIRILMIIDAMPRNKEESLYVGEKTLAIENTLNAFKEAGYAFNSIDEVLNSGIYITSTIKCCRTGNVIPANIIKKCSCILEQELRMFPNTKCILCMGDAAIKAVNYISKRQTGENAIPKGSTYKIRKGKFYFNKICLFPSYLQTGKNFLIEKSKRKMVAEDIKEAAKIAYAI